MLCHFQMSSALRIRASLLRIVVQSRNQSSSSLATTSAAPADDFNFDDIVESLKKSAASTSNKGLSFPTMLRRSKFMQLGDFDGRLMVGKVERRVADDLYIDFGLKFHTVCKAPSINNEAYVRGSRVLLRLHDPELSERFLGSKRDLTLLEADAALMRLLYSPAMPRKRPAAEGKEKKDKVEKETKEKIENEGEQVKEETSTGSTV